MLNNIFLPKNQKAPHILKNEYLSIEGKMLQSLFYRLLRFLRYLHLKTWKETATFFLSSTNSQKNKGLYRYLSLPRMKSPVRHKKAEELHLLFCFANFQ